MDDKVKPWDKPPEHARQVGQDVRFDEDFIKKVDHLVSGQVDSEGRFLTQLVREGGAEAEYYLSWALYNLAEKSPEHRALYEEERALAEKKFVDKIKNIRPTNGKIIE